MDMSISKHSMDIYRYIEISVYIHDIQMLELPDGGSENGTEQGSDDQTTATDNSRKVKTKKPRKSAVIPRCDFIFVLLSKPKS